MQRAKHTAQCTAVDLCVDAHRGAAWQYDLDQPLSSRRSNHRHRCIRCQRCGRDVSHQRRHLLPPRHNHIDAGEIRRRPCRLTDKTARQLRRQV
jgi:hypothetical protein